MFRNFLFYVNVLVIGAFTFGSSAADVFTIQLEANRTQAGAQARISHWTSQGYSPTFVHQDGAWHLVLFGKFDNATDALACQRYLRQEELSNIALVRIFDEQDLPGATQSNPTLPDPLLEPPSVYFTLQLGSYKEQSLAIRRKSELEVKGYGPLQVFQNGSLYVLYLGRFAAVAVAEVIKDDLRSAGIVDDALIAIFGTDEASPFSTPETVTAPTATSLVSELTTATSDFYTTAGLDQAPASIPVYSIEWSDFTSVSEAEDFASELQGLGYSPVSQVGREVTFGHFEVQADALSFGKEFERRYPVKAFQLKGDRLTQAQRSSLFLGNSQIASGPQQSILWFDKNPLQPLAGVSGPRLELFINRGEAQSKVQAGGLPTFTAGTNEARQRVEQLIKGGDDGWTPSRQRTMPAMVGRSAARLAEDFRKQGRENEAIYYWLQTARNPSWAADTDRAQAAWHAAKALHRTTDRLSAYQVYGELHEALGQASEQAACARELAGLLIELAECDMGTMEEARERIRGMRGNLTAAGLEELQAKVRLDLLYAESFAKERKFEEAVVHLRKFVGCYRDVVLARKDLAAALIWLGISEDMLGNRERAISSFEEVMGLNLKSEENFAIGNFEAMAARWLFQGYYRDGNEAGMSLWAEYLRTIHPDTPETHNMNRVYKTYQRHHSN
jgi:tetratricopeptide (TPR) repeat protein